MSKSFFSIIYLFNLINLFIFVVGVIMNGTEYSRFPKTLRIQRGNETLILKTGIVINEAQKF